MSVLYNEFMSALKPGLWIKVWTSPISVSGKNIYCWHHGIVSHVDGTDIRVIHFGNGAASKEPRVVETPIEWFLNNGTKPQFIDGEPAFELDDVVERARGYLGADGYRLPMRNCEHFASHCYNGSAFSKQVYAFGIGVGVMAAIGGVVSVVAVKLAKSRWI